MNCLLTVLSLATLSAWQDQPSSTKPLPDRPLVVQPGIDQLDDASMVAAGAGFCRDLDGDGCSDYFVSSRDGLRNHSGVVALFSGKSGRELQRIVGPPGDPDFGGRLVVLDDVNGDKAPDFAISGGAGSGCVYVCSGSAGDVLHVVRGGPDEVFFGSDLLGLPATSEALQKVVILSYVALKNNARYAEGPDGPLADIAATAVTLKELDCATGKYEQVASLDSLIPFYALDTTRNTFALSSALGDEIVLCIEPRIKLWPKELGSVLVYSCSDRQTVMTIEGAKLGMAIGWSATRVGDLDGDKVGEFAIGVADPDKLTYDPTGVAICSGADGHFLSYLPVPEAWETMVACGGVAIGRQLSFQQPREGGPAGTLAVSLMDLVSGYGVYLYSLGSDTPPRRLAVDWNDDCFDCTSAPFLSQIELGSDINGDRRGDLLVRFFWMDGIEDSRAPRGCFIYDGGGGGLLRAHLAIDGKQEK